MIVKITITDKSSFELDVPGTNFTKFAEDIEKAGGLETLLGSQVMWYYVTQIQSIELVSLS